MVNINLFGGPGTGKSTSAAGLFYKMKSKGYKVEYIQEYAKELTFGKDFIKLADQLLILGVQHHRMFRLKNQVEYVIHDSPFIMGMVYLQEDSNIPQKEYSELIVKMFKSYKNINIFLERDTEHHKYQDYGRSQTLEESLLKDKEIKSLLIDNDIPFHEVKIGNKSIKKILKIIKKGKNETFNIN